MTAVIIVAYAVGWVICAVELTRAMGVVRNGEFRMNIGDAAIGSVIALIWPLVLVAYLILFIARKLP